MHRREFLRMGGSSLFLLGGGLAQASATPQAKGSVLVVVFQRGAADALHMVVPYRDEAYRILRGQLALDEPGRGERPTLDLGGGFAFHPALSPLYPLYQAGRLAAVINTGSTDPTRSHFDAQDYMESGTPGRKATRDGWMARALAALGSRSLSPFAAVALARQMPRSLSGAMDAIALEDFDSLVFPERTEPLLERIERLYENEADARFVGAGREAFRALEMLREKEPFATARSTGVRDRGARGRDPLSQLAKLITADLGVRIAFVESEGWDTHFNQGGTTGQMANLLSDLAGSLAAFVRDVPDTVPVTVLAITEFGRTVAINGAGGTDHGHGGAMLVAGSAVRGGRVHGDWLGLETRNLHEGRDLPVTTDFRDVFSEVAKSALGLDDTGELFPDYRASRVGVMSGV